MKPGSHISCSWECKRVWGNEPPHSQVNSHFESRTPKFLEGNCKGQNSLDWRVFLYHWKAFETKMFKMGSHDPFKHLKHKLWPKEGPGVKLAVWLPTTKNFKSPWLPCIQVVCHIPLKSSWWGYNFSWYHTSIGGLHTKLWASKVAKVPI